MRLVLLLGFVLTVLVLPGGQLRAQIQSGGMTAGMPGPGGSPESPADLKKKTGLCNKAAGQYKLRGADRKTYLERCLAIRYSPDFKPPTWPLS
jgi:psiF repeat